jgi:hypothetical protein
VTDCAACGRANEETAQFCGGCGRPLAGNAVPPPPPPPPGGPGLPVDEGGRSSSLLRARLRRLFLRPNPRVLLATLLVVAFVLGIVSIGTAWWSYSSSAGGTSHSLNFLPGGNYNVTCSGSGCGGFSAGSFPYSNFGGSIGTLYGVVLGLMAVGVALTGFAALVAVLAALGRRTGWWQRSGSFVLAFFAILSTLIAVLATVAAQPSAFAPNTMFDGLGTGGASPMTSFWGSNAAGTATWGAGLGWYLGLATIVLLGVIAGLLIVFGHQRLAVPGRRTRTAATPSPSVSPVARGYTAPPAAVAPARPVAMRPPIPSAAKIPAPPPPVTAPPAAPDMVSCPTCGTQNLAKSRTCSYCQRSLR